ncbi:MAG: hypothetical protein HUK15_07940 [Bacteroidales bacterium]|nr:hypothetical protein [Bacteroidales bacterium]
MHKFLSLEGCLLIFGYLLLSFLLVWLIAFFKYSKDEETKRYFFLGFAFKIICCLGYAVVYDFYYNWEGDTFYYFRNSNLLAQILYHEPSLYFNILFDQVDPATYNPFSHEVLYVPHFRDPSVYALHRFLSLFAIIGSNNYYAMNIVVAVAMYLLNWQFFQYLVGKKLNISVKVLFICLMMIPSVQFWSSSLSKDTFTYTFSFVLVMCFSKIFIDRKLSVMSVFGLFLSAYVVMILKTYILYSVLAACMVWLFVGYMNKIKNKLLRFFALPVLIMVIAFGGMYALRYISLTVGGHYSDIDSMLEKAMIAQADLKQEYYEGHSFDIGNFDGTLMGMIGLAPKAIFASLFRPHLFECEGIVMLLSGLENTVLLFLVIFVFLKAGIIFSLKQMITNPFIGMCIVLTLVMALGIGISTANFGALVRFKIPVMPFLLIGMLEIYAMSRKKLEEEER